MSQQPKTARLERVHRRQTDLLARASDSRAFGTRAESRVESEHLRVNPVVGGWGQCDGLGKYRCARIEERTDEYLLRSMRQVNFYPASAANGARGRISTIQ